VVPAGLDDCGSYELGADVALAEFFLVKGIHSVILCISDKPLIAFDL
jgi:hypothetical protein